MTDTPYPHPNLAHMPLVDVLRLIRTLNVGPMTFYQLIRRFGTAKAALERLPELSLKGGRLKAVEPFNKAQAEKEIALAEKFGARFLRYGEPSYPPLLLQIADAPPVITVLGHAELARHAKPLAMVGARNASANGLHFAGKLARELGAEGFLITSGLARGVDAAVHKAALAQGTLAVIAGGIDTMYPPENAMLYEALKQTGCIISEQPFGQAPFSSAFPGRNRIISGMSLGVIVVEASPKSGSLITARFALEQNREVFAIPGSPLDPRAKGCNQLIRQGAHMVEDVGDVLRQLRHADINDFKEHALPLFAFAEEAAQKEPDEQELADARTLILTQLTFAPVAMETLMEAVNLPQGVVLTVVLELELAGRLNRLPGNRLSLQARDIEEEAS